MDVKINGVLSGVIAPPPSKSQAHRLLICAALGTEPCSVECSAVNDDIIATMNSLNALGADIKYDDACFDVTPIKLKKGGVLNCGESGSTLRFLLSVAAVLGADATFIGSGKLPYRPNNHLCEVLEAHGIVFERKQADAELPVVCKGVLHGGEYRLPGNISSQYLTGLLFALPLAAESSCIEIVDGLTSASYVEMTIDAVRKAGITINKENDKYIIPGGQHYNLPGNLVVEGDWSSAAFWIVAGVVGKHPITVCGMDTDSIQGDRRVIDHLRKMGACIVETESGVTAMPSHLFGAEIDCVDTPDLVPVLSVAAAAAEGQTLFTNVGRLRFKECDRLSAINAMLASFGVSSQIGDDTLLVYGGKACASTPVDSFSDHRIAMSAAILSLMSDADTVINGAECVAKSYPRFFEDFVALGGSVAANLEAV